MTWGFEVGRTYNRRQDIHGRFRGQQQGGIITPTDHPLVILITGEAGSEHGYDDRYRPDGVFEYFGEGQIGDMRFRAGNRAILEHSKAGKSLLLFRKSASGLKFEGEMVCEGYHVEPAQDREGTSRSAIVFELRPLNGIVEQIDADIDASDINLGSLRQAALTSTAVPNEGKASVRNVYQRSRDVRRYVLARAKGRCEGCSLPAPFKRPDGTGYLEPHHLRRVSDGGPDHPAHVIALCPNCHRRVHAGADGPTYNDQLRNEMKRIEFSEEIA